MTKFRKKPVVIEAKQWNGIKINDIDAAIEFENWLVPKQDSKSPCRVVGQVLRIPTLEGVMEASPGDWIICGVKGELYPCKPDIFEATYEPA